jgi:hypothetical protein
LNKVESVCPAAATPKCRHCVLNGVHTYQRPPEPNSKLPALKFLVDTAIIWRANNGVRLAAAATAGDLSTKFADRWHRKGEPD